MVSQRRTDVMCRILCKLGILAVALFVLSLFFLPQPKRLTPQDALACADSAPLKGEVFVAESREFDIVIHGATGFTGELVAKYLAKHPARPIYAIAGRSQKKLDALTVAIEASGGRRPDGLIIADSLDSEALLAMAKRAKVVLAAAGPYAKYGTELVRACASAGTHYADLSGESFWQRRMLDAYHESAMHSGAKLVLAAGYDSVPFDLGTQLALKYLDEVAGKRAEHVSVTSAIVRQGGLASGGTLASGMGQMKEVRDGLASAEWDNDPYLLVPESRCELDAYVTGWGPFPRWSSLLGAFAVPHFMAPINARIIRRSLDLLGRRDVSYAEGMTFGALVDSVRFVLSFVLSGDIDVKTDLLPKPGDGPSLAVQMSGSYEGVFVASDTQGNRATLTMRGKGDPGYRHTSKLLAEVGLCLVDAFCHRSESGGGILTPMSAVNRDTFAKRLSDARHDDGSSLLTYTRAGSAKDEL